MMDVQILCKTTVLEAGIQCIGLYISTFPVWQDTYIFIQGFYSIQVNHRIVQSQNSCVEKKY